MYLFSLNIYDFAKYIAGCRAKKLNLCCIMLIAKNKFVILNEIFFLTDLHLSKIEKLYTSS